VYEEVLSGEDCACFENRRWGIHRIMPIFATNGKAFGISFLLRVL
jgi:hypothetical protein